MKTIAKKKSKITLQACITWMMSELQTVTQQVVKDKEKMENDFHKFLQWGQGAFEHVSYQKWLRIYMDVALTWLKAGRTVEEFLDHVTQTIVNEATVSISGSMHTHNLMEHCDRVSKAKIVHEMKQALKYNTFF